MEYLMEQLNPTYRYGTQCISMIACIEGDKLSLFRLSYLLTVLIRHLNSYLDSRTAIIR